MNLARVAQGAYDAVGVQQTITITGAAGPATYEDVYVRSRTRRAAAGGSFVKESYIEARIPALADRVAPVEGDILEWEGRKYTVDSVDTKPGRWIVEAM